MRRVLLMLLGAALTGCQWIRPEPPPPIVVTDTVRIEVEPTPPEGRPVQLCLSTGVTVTVHVTASGDTLVGEKRIRLADVRPPLVFPGSYAGNAPWFTRAEIIRFDGRGYQRAGVERVRECDELKLVGEHQGVPLFAEVTAPQILPVLIVPVRPGVFQDYLRVR